ncbi:hypothetical protein DL98DRAFT_509502 [Cadophora sp. DSE1049]|nr:hypothetical protein DL98DRAFT_509502 [Cadophora sp. DSE1049]
MSNVFFRLRICHLHRISSNIIPLLSGTSPGLNRNDNTEANVKMVWLRLAEVWLTARLLNSTTFHKLVKRVHKKVHEIKLGEKLEDPSEMGGTNIDTPKHDTQRFLRYYMEELKDQFRGTTKK